MLIHNKGFIKKNNSSLKTLRLNTSNKLTAENIQFLKSLGLKVKKN